MKLIAKHKDFYDPIIHQFGVDPLLVWKRSPKSLKERDVGEILSKDRPYLYRVPAPFGHTFNAAYLILNDRVFIYAYTINKDLMGLPMDHPHRYKFYDAEEVFYKTRGRYDRTHKWEEFVAEVNDRYGKLTDHFGQPIVGFVPQPGHLCRAEKVCTGEDYSTWWLNPLIANLPITKDLTGQQVYEEILKFFCRTAQPKDPAPQPEYTRIESAGFDLKTSFRHRK